MLGKPWAHDLTQSRDEFLIQSLPSLRYLTVISLGFFLLPHASRGMLLSTLPSSRPLRQAPLKRALPRGLFFFSGRLPKGSLKSLRMDLSALLFQGGSAPYGAALGNQISLITAGQQARVLVRARLYELGTVCVPTVPFVIFWACLMCSVNYLITIIALLIVLVWCGVLRVLMRCCSPSLGLI